MIKITLTFSVILSVLILFAQTPQAFKYQAVARDISGNVLQNQNVSFQISILQGSESGVNIYTETHDTTTNEFGLINLEIGKGEVVSGVFGDIDWGGDSYFLQIEMDENGGDSYQLIGTSQLLSVPFALNAFTSNDVVWEKSNDDIFFTNGNVGIGTETPSSSSILELNSDTKGLRLPRLTTSQIENFNNPVDGLIVFNTDFKALNIYDGLNWYTLMMGECVPQPSIAVAGPDEINNNNDTVSLQGNSPVYGTGLWSIITGTGGVFSDPGNPNSEFSGLSDTEYVLKWSISTACDTTADNVNVQFYEVDNAYFVSKSGTDANPGTYLLPFLTITHAISQAQAEGVNTINIAEGEYSETISLISDLTINGGFEDTTWIRDQSKYITKIYGGTKAIIGNSIDNVTIDRLSVYSSNATINGESSYAVHLTNSTGITLNENEIFPGNGASGDNGSNGLFGINGNWGQNGYPGCADGSFPCANSCSEPQGGLGGFSPFGSDGGQGGNPGYNNYLGYNGQYGLGPSGGSGGSAVTWDNMSSCTGSYVSGYPANGFDGANGVDGLNGSGGLAIGSINSAGYVPSDATDGLSDGTHGSGGGGGAGGYGGSSLLCDSYGSSGGGGGAGGSGGARGTAGTGGGGSFGIFSYNSTITVEYCQISTGNGGNGGHGGTGGLGGQGGIGGQGGSYGGSDEQGDAGCGGWGGNGGEGGLGGHAGGGGGGPTIGIFYQVSSISQSNNTFILGSPGSGGFGNGATGATGLVAEEYGNF